MKLITKKKKYAKESNHILKQSKYYKPQSLQSSILQITRTSRENESMGIIEDFSFFKTTTNSKKHLIRFKDIKHREFTSYCLMGLENYGSGRLYPYSIRTHEAIPTLYDFIVQYLNANLKNDKKSNEFINKNTIYVCFK